MGNGAVFLLHFFCPCSSFRPPWRICTLKMGTTGRWRYSTFLYKRERWDRCVLYSAGSILRRVCFCVGRATGAQNVFYCCKTANVCPFAFFAFSLRYSSSNCVPQAQDGGRRKQAMNSETHTQFRTMQPRTERSLTTMLHTCRIYTARKANAKEVHNRAFNTYTRWSTRSSARAGEKRRGESRSRERVAISNEQMVDAVVGD